MSSQQNAQEEERKNQNNSAKPYGAHIYNRHGVFDTNRLRLIIYTPMLAN